MNFAQWGYDSFLIRTILIPTTQSPLEARNAIPTGSLSASQFSTPMNPTTTIVFSSTDYNTAAWAAGIIYFANGTQSEVITAGNTGNITATTYVYYDKDKSPVIQTTTTPSVATGSNKFLLAIVELGVSGKDCKITPTIAAGLVVSGLTAKSISVDQLDALAVNTGTLTVDESITAGGSTDGIIYVKDSSNNTKVQLDQDGIAIDSGKLTIKDDAETTVIDAKGLVSATSFPQSAIEVAALNQSITTAEPNWTDITDATFTFSLDRSALVLVQAKVSFWSVNDGGSDDSLIRIVVDGEYLGGRMWFRDATVSVTGNMHNLAVLSSGSHTIKLQGTINTTSGSPTLNIYNYYVSYIILGK